MQYSSAITSFERITRDQMDAGLPYDCELPEFPVDHLSGKRVMILTARCPEEIELVFPYLVLKRAGCQVDIVTPAWIGDRVDMTNFVRPSIWVPVDRHLEDVTSIDEYDGLIIPGGAWNPIILRSNEDALRLVRQFNESRKLVASICHGPQVLISAGVVRNRHITGVADIRTDLANAGAIVVTDRPVVKSGNLLTSRDPNDIVQFTMTIVQVLSEMDSEANAPTAESEVTCGSVALLTVLRCQNGKDSDGKDSDGKEYEGKDYAVMTVPPRFCTGSFDVFEVPAGKLDGSGNFVGVAATEMKQELGFEIKNTDLTNLSKVTGNPDGFYLSPGDSEETIRLFLYEKNVTRKELNDMEGRLAGDQITLKIVPLEDLWTVADATTVVAYTLYQKARWRLDLAHNLECIQRMYEGHTAQ